MEHHRTTPAGLKPMARMVAHARHSQAPEEFTIAPIGAIGKLFEKTGWGSEDVDLFEINEAFAMVTMLAMQEIGLDYARTLGDWRQRFMSKLDNVRALGFDDSFIRMWEYYLCYCQGGFEERIIGTSQILFAKPDWRPAAT